ncbi:MAG: hypothetical protein ACH350_02060 [Parachlamydiaceae bacterium]
MAHRLMNSLFHVDIPKRSSLCAHSGERLLPGMEIYSLLFEDQNSSHLSRRDYCLTCWHTLEEKSSSQSPVRGYWKSKIEIRKEGEEGSTRIERALALLRRLEQMPEPAEAEMFVLCLFLSHARQIALRQDIQKEGISYHVYEILGREEFLTVKVINLSDFQIEALQRSLANQLQSLSER